MKLTLEVNPRFVYDRIDIRDGATSDPNRRPMPDGTTVILSPCRTVKRDGHSV